MPDAAVARNITATLNDYMRRERMTEIEAVPATKVLEKMGVLADYAPRAGKPLRIYLRASMIPGAYKDNGRWFIRGT